jgi:hypothetical protein
MKKEEYSKINHPHIKRAKKEFKKDPNLFKRIDSFIRFEFEKGGSIQDLSTKSNENLFYKTIVEDRKYNNYYIESKELSDFFCNTLINKKIFPNIQKVINNNFENICRIIDVKRFTFNSKILTGIIYHKSFDKSIFFMFTLHSNNKYTKNYLYTSDGNNHWSFPLTINYLQDINNNENSIIFKFVLNMIFYMDAFPDKINNKPPEELCDKLNFNNSKTISIAKDIENYLHENRDVSPHLRRGHFRYLDSERFVNKKGQTIFVKSTMVKGKAITITE